MRTRGANQKNLDMTLNRIFLWLAFALFCPMASAQYPGWQQAVEYSMEITLDTAQHQYTGAMKVVLQNNSPDDLDRAFFHLFFNAFQPGSMMDVRSRTIEDPDRRVGSRIFELPEDEWGWQRVKSLTVNGKPVQFTHDGTILDVALNDPIGSGKKCTFEMEWDAQVPRQIRRSGWMNREGIEYSMTQWYPKLCEYDHDGWHTEPYVGREFHGIWGDYDVTIHLPAGCPVGATGVLQGDEEQALTSGTWRFVAENVIDFAWASDPDYVHDTLQAGQVMLHFYHQPLDEEYAENWKQLPAYTAKAMDFLNELIGPYPYPQYSVIQGGDGGMEYPMATLITGNRSLQSLVGVTVHEMAHSWFQALLATNESLYEFMDEGMTSYATELCMNHLFAGPGSDGFPHRGAYSGYISQALSGKEEPLITHADHYQTNRAYGVAAYSKGEVLVAQLAAIMGEESRDTGLKKYYEDWKFKHPGPQELKRAMEQSCGFDLDWYFQYFINTTHTIDYAIDQVIEGKEMTTISCSRIGAMPMPQNITITYQDGSKASYLAPLVMMRGHRPLKKDEVLLPDWPWTHPTYTFEIPTLSGIAAVELDADRQTADVNRENNLVELNGQARRIFKRN
ncbi:MAG: M1 family metallopeptidase [Flavobacteriales bacterium]